MSMDKVIAIERKDFVVPQWLLHFGNYNQAPDPLEEVDINEYFHYNGIYTPKYLETRCLMRWADDKPIIIDGKSRILNVHIYWYHDRAYMVAQKVERAQGVAPTQAWHIGCRHTNTTCRKGSPWNEYTCTACGYRQEIDSSD